MRFPKLALVATIATFATFAAQDGRKEAVELPEPPEIGAAAPSFRLNDHTGTAVRIGGEGPTWSVLAFFPKAATPG